MPDRVQPTPLTFHLGKDQAERDRILEGLDRLVLMFGLKSRSELIKKIGKGELLVTLPPHPKK